MQWLARAVVAAWVLWQDGSELTLLIAAWSWAPWPPSRRWQLHDAEVQVVCKAYMHSFLCSLAAGGGAVPIPRVPPLLHTIVRQFYHSCAALICA
jgi:hypothetical protein